MAIVTQSQAVSRTAPEPFGGSRYARYALGLLFLVYVVNFVDRQILVILLHPSGPAGERPVTDDGSLRGGTVRGARTCS